MAWTGTASDGHEGKGGAVPDGHVGKGGYGVRRGGVERWHQMGLRARGGRWLRTDRRVCWGDGIGLA